MKEIIPSERILNKIYIIRGIKVMLDRDIAELYGVETRVLKQSVRRNINRFPEDFMFELTKKEFENWRSQIVMSNEDKIGLRHSPMVFTEQGVAMLSSVLNSDRAIQVNIQIIRAFTKLRQMISSHEGLSKKVEAMEKKYDKQFRMVFEALKELLKSDSKPKKKIGFELKKDK